MPAQPASDELLDFIVEAEAKQNDGSYNCEVFTAQIQAAIRDLDNAKLASRSHSAGTPTAPRDKITPE